MFKNLKPEYAILVGVALTLVIGAASWIGITTSNDTQQMRNNIQLINPPQQILDGTVDKLVTTVVYDVKNDTETQLGGVVYFCSGENWTIPPGKINIVKKWLRSELVPNNGCTTP